MKAEADITEQKIWLDCEIREYPVLKDLPGFLWDPNRERWSAPLTWPACVQLRATFGDGLELGPTLERWAWQEREDRLDPVAYLQRHYLGDGRVGEDPRLRPYQDVGARWLAVCDGGVLADEMRLGKTVQVAVAMRGMAPCLIVCPNTAVARQWKDELLTWAELDADDVALVIGSASKRRKEIARGAPVMITTYGSLQAHTRLASFGSAVALRRCKECGGPKELKVSRCEAHHKELNDLEFELVVLDEAHRIKDPKAKRTRACWRLCDQAARVWALTGTPVANHVGDLWSLLRAINGQEWSHKTKFMDRYVDMAFNMWGGLEIHGVKPGMREEFDRVVGPRLLRRTKREVAPELPEELPWSVIHVEQTSAQRKAYVEARDDLLAKIEAGMLVIGDTLTQTIRLRQLASASLKVVEDEEERYELSEPSSKLDRFMEVMEELEEVPVVIFAEAPRLLDLARARLEKVGWRCSTYHGSMPDQTRQYELERWKVGETQLLLVGIAAGAEGLTLARASHVVWLQRPWSSLQFSQAKARVVLLEKTEPITHIELRTEDTIEARVAEVLEQKAERLEDVVRDKTRLKELL